MGYYVCDTQVLRRVFPGKLKPDYRKKLDAELKALHDSEMWRTGEVVRKLRPENN